MLYTDVRSGVHADLASLVKFRPTNVTNVGVQLQSW